MFVVKTWILEPPKFKVPIIYQPSYEPSLVHLWKNSPQPHCLVLTPRQPTHPPCLFEPLIFGKVWVSNSSARDVEKQHSVNIQKRFNETPFVWKLHPHNTTQNKKSQVEKTPSWMPQITPKIRLSLVDSVLSGLKATPIWVGATENRLKTWYSSVTLAVFVSLPDDLFRNIWTIIGQGFLPALWPSILSSDTS